MNFRPLTGIAALGLVLLASCHPYNEKPAQQPTGKPPEKTVTSADQQKIKEQQDQMKAKEEAKKQIRKSMISEVKRVVSKASGHRKIRL